MAPSNFYTSLCNQLKTRESRIISALVEAFDLKVDEVTEVFASVEVGLTKTGKVKKARDPNKPKGPLNGYMYFSSQMREEVKELLTKKKSERTFKDSEGKKVTLELREDGTIKPTDVSKKLGVMWRALPDDEKDEWLARKDEHNKSMGHVKKAPAKKAATKKKATAKSKKGAKSKETLDSGDSDTDENEPEAPPPKDDSDSSDSDSEPEESPKPVKKAPVKKTAKKTAKGKGKGKK